MTPQELRARAAELREAGAKLRRRPAAEIREALARVLEGWRQPDSPWRQELERRLPEATGLHPTTVREGLARGLSPWTGDALRDLVRDELGTRPVSGFDLYAVLLAGEVPMPSLLSLLAPLALGSPVLAKSASRDPVSAELVARSIAETDAELGQCVAVTDFPSTDDASLRALLEADCVVANGSDETLAAVASRLPPGRRFVGYGHRISLAVVGREARPEEVARHAALDVGLWDQLGCLSPVALYLLDASDAACDRLATALADALAQLELGMPRGAIDPAAAAAIARERAEAEMRAAGGARVTLLAGPGTSWTVVREADARSRPAPLHRFLRVHPVRDAAALLDAIRPLARHLAAVGVAGLGKRAPELGRALVELGASRVCPLGQLQSPPLSWPREGQGVLLPLARLARTEGIEGPD